jgi:hypothetical protein
VNPAPIKSHWFFVLAALEAGAAFFLLFRVPHTGEGFSIIRMAMLAVLSAFLILSIYFAYRTPERFAQSLRPEYAIIVSLLALIFAIGLFLLRFIDPSRFLIYYERISPVLFYVLILLVQFTIFVLISYYGFHFDNYFSRSNIYKPTLVAFAVLIATLLFICFTRIGLIPDNAYWGEPGVPLMGWQFGAAILAGGFTLLVSLRGRAISRFENILPIAIWFLAVVIWLSVPVSVMQNSFYGPITPPTNQSLPNSDAGYYDSMAQSLLIGYPYLGGIPTRPFYIVFLAVLHLVTGNKYNLIIAGQTLVLALIPVLFYFLGKKLHSITAGVIIAFFAIFRELTSLMISSQTRVSNTKTLLVDLPTLLLILAGCLFTLRWLERRDWKSGLEAGGIFGILLLLRTQSLIILPVLFILVILVYGMRNRSWAPALAFFLLGFAVTTGPWLLHNFLESGQLTFDAPFEYQVVASQYKYTGNLDLQNIDLQGKSLFGILLTFAIKDPKFVLGFIATHFFATQINGILALPMIEAYNGLTSPINLYWMKWDGNPSWFNLILIIIYLAIIAVGLGAVWKGLRWIGVTPLAFSLGYSIANGLGRFSGWRYDLPADWISYFYFGIGISEILGVSALLFGAKSEKIFTPLTDHAQPNPKLKQGLLLGVVFALIGALPWMAEGIITPRYSDKSPAMLITTLSDSSAVEDLGVNRVEIETFLASPQTTLQIGRVLYPRFFTRNNGLSSSHPWPAYTPRDFPRTGFLLINQSQRDIVLPSRVIPNPFPSETDAVILGCQRTDYIEARLILFPEPDIVYLSLPITDPCN